MTDLIINRIDKTVHVLTRNLNRSYELINDNIDMYGYASSKWYIIDIKSDNNFGKLIFPTEQTNVVLIG